MLSKIGKVCVPLDPSSVESFDPDSVPTVGQLLMELEEASRRGDVDAGWEKTSLNEYVELFNRHCDGIIRDANKKRREEGKGKFLRMGTNHPDDRC